MTYEVVKVGMDSDDCVCGHDPAIHEGVRGPDGTLFWTCPECDEEASA